MNKYPSAEELRVQRKERERAHLEAMKQLAPTIHRLREMVDGAEADADEWRAIIPAVNQGLYRIFEASNFGVVSDCSEQDFHLQLILLDDIVYLKNAGYISTRDILFFKRIGDALRDQFNRRQKYDSLSKVVEGVANLNNVRVQQATGTDG